MQADSLPAEPPGKTKNTGVGSLSLLQGILLTQELNQDLLHYRWILYQLSYWGNPLKSFYNELRPFKARNNDTRILYHTPIYGFSAYFSSLRTLGALLGPCQPWKRSSALGPPCSTDVRPDPGLPGHLGPSLLLEPVFSSWSVLVVLAAF